MRCFGSILDTNAKPESNIAIGNLAGYRNKGGNSNIYIGSGDFDGTSNLTGVDYTNYNKDANGIVTKMDNNKNSSIISSYTYGYANPPSFINESNTIRIGNIHTTAPRTFINGITGITPGNPSTLPVIVDINGQLGVVSSSARYKLNIKTIDLISEKIYHMRPVEFVYKINEMCEEKCKLQYGLIAEEVYEIMPEVVTVDKNNNPQGIQYHKFDALFINELQKHQKKINEQQIELQNLKLEIEEIKNILYK
jgi:hypothetical protein